MAKTTSVAPKVALKPTVDVKKVEVKKVESTRTATAPKAAAPIAAKPVAAKPVILTATKKPTVTKAVVKKTVVKKPAVKKVDKADKTPKLKMERDSFTMPKAEYAQLYVLKERLLKLNTPAKKSELLRAGIMQLTMMSDAVLQAAMSKVPTIKTGRPKKK